MHNSRSPLTIGVHETGLARAQAEYVADRLGRSGPSFPVHLEIVGQVREQPPPLHDDHIAENRSDLLRLHQLLRDGHIDVVIHRGFDLRGSVPPDLCVAAVLARSNPFDALISPRELSLDELEEGSRVGVVHLRARAQLLEYRPDLEWELIEGDVGCWLTAMIDGRIEALVAPGAALEQLKLQERVCELFPPEMLLPAPGSGVLLCLVRSDDAESQRRLRKLHHPPTAMEYGAECAFMEALGGPWEFPIAALSQCKGDDIALAALVATVDGRRVLRDCHSAGCEDPARVGVELAALMLEAGAGELLSDVSGKEGSVSSCEASIDPVLAGLLLGDTDWEEDCDLGSIAEPTGDEEEDE